MQIAIHHRPGSFSENWINFCKERHIRYKIVDCYRYNIIDHLRDCDGLMWHHSHINYKDSLFAKELLYALEQSGKKVFPSFNTGWHFDDKVGQKYLLESIQAPLIPTYIFFDKESAFNWSEQTAYPKVFKLRRGSAGLNVKLVQTKEEAQKLIATAFSKGFTAFNHRDNFQNYAKQLLSGQADLNQFFKKVGRTFVPTEFSRFTAREKGYIYFQDFIPNNETDFRVKVIGNHCWGFQRKTRKNDFRASGSGKHVYGQDSIPTNVLKQSFEIAQKLQLQSVAFDFILDNNQPVVVELSFGFGMNEEQLNFGYWTSDLKWHNEKFNPFHWMMNDFIRSIDITS